MAYRRLRCKSCSNYLVPWGKSATGKKRFRCRNCGISRIFTIKITDFPVYELFKQYVLWGLTYQILSYQSGYSIRYLEHCFHLFMLKSPPDLPPIEQSHLEVAFLLIDGLWFGRWFVLMVYRQSKNLTILRIAVAGKEVATKIVKDLKWLKTLYRFSGIVSDGGTGIRKAVWEVFPHVPHQICMAHLHRDIVNAIGRHPKDKRVKKLKRIADHIWLIESKEALTWWKNKLRCWINANSDFLREYHRDEENHWWYIHTGVRKAVRILVSLPDTSFAFLDHPLMPKTTNELEGQFNHLAHRWLSHRGLKKERWEIFMMWFVYFYNQEKLSSRKSRKA